MNSRVFAMVLLSTGALMSSPFPAHAAQKNSGPEAAKKQLDDARQKAQAANKQIGEAEKKWQQSEANYQSELGKEQKAVQDASQKEATELGLADAMTALQQAQHEAQDVRQSLMTALKTSSDYQAATKDAEAASEKLQRVRDDTSLSEEQREQKSSALSPVIRLPAEMEHKRVEGDPQLKAALARVTAAQQKVDEIRAKINAAVQKDPNVQSALTEAKKAATDAQTATKELADARKARADAENQVSREQRAYQLAQEQSRMKKKR